MAMTLNGKTPAVAMLPDGDVVTMYNDVIQHTVEAMVLKNNEEDTESLFESNPPPINSRCLMFARSQARRVVEPVRFVGVSPNDHFNSKELNPFYEVINPEIKTINGSESAFVMFWTNFIEMVTDYDADKVLKFSQDSLEFNESTVYRALCSTMIRFEKYYITGGAVATTSGNDPSVLAEDVRNTYDIIAIATKPTILQIYQDDYPVVDFASGGGGSGGGLRRHDHSTNNPYDGGFAFAIMHPGTAVPQKPWEAN